MKQRNEKCVDKGLAMGVNAALKDLARPGKVPEIGRGGTSLGEPFGLREAK